MYLDLLTYTQRKKFGEYKKNCILNRWLVNTSGEKARSRFLFNVYSVFYY